MKCLDLGCSSPGAPTSPVIPAGLKHSLGFQEGNHTHRHLSYTHPTVSLRAFFTQQLRWSPVSLTGFWIKSKHLSRAAGLCSTEPQLYPPPALAPTILLPIPSRLDDASLTGGPEAQQPFHFLSLQTLPPGHLMAGSLGALQPHLSSLSPHLKNLVRQVRPLFMETALFLMEPTGPGTENNIALN